MENNQEQKIKGDNNTQQLITINGNYVVGLQKDDVMNLIQAYCYTDKEQIADIVKETIESNNG